MYVFVFVFVYIYICTFIHTYMCTCPYIAQGCIGWMIFELVRCLFERRRNSRRGERGGSNKEQPWIRDIYIYMGSM